MTVFVNGETHYFIKPTTVAGIVRRLGYHERGMAIAVNREVVPRSEWDTYHLQSGDRIEILQAAQGG